MGKAITTVLGDKRYLMYFAAIFGLLFFILLQIQVQAIPGNDLRFQARIFSFRDWILLVFISALNSLFVTTEIYIFKLKKEYRETIGLAKNVVAGGVGTTSGVLASVFGTATCSLYVSALFGFLGANSVLFLVNHKDLITSAALILLLISLFISSRRFNAACKTCKV